jgi:hypothetical protein
MIEVKEGTVVNPNLVTKVRKTRIEDKRGQLVSYGLEISYNFSLSDYRHSYSETFHYGSEKERDRIYSLFYNATARVSMTNTIKTSEERHWDL